MSEKIINADDFGRSHKVNEAVKIGILDGRIQRASLMLNMPGTEEAVKMAFENKFDNKIGLHINLSEGIPVNELSLDSFLCTKGEFNSCINRRNNPSLRILCSLYEQKIIRHEVEKQMQIFRELGFTGSHFDSHRNTHFNLGVLWCIRNLIAKYEFDSIRFKNMGKKSISDKLYSTIIRKYNLQHSDYFFSYREWVKVKKSGGIFDDVELSIHPYLNDEGLICDSVGIINFEEI